MKYGSIEFRVENVFSSTCLCSQDILSLFVYLLHLILYFTWRLEANWKQNQRKQLLSACLSYTIINVIREKKQSMLTLFVRSQLLYLCSVHAVLGWQYTTIHSMQDIFMIRAAQKQQQHQQQKIEWRRRTKVPSMENKEAKPILIFSQYIYAVVVLCYTWLETALMELLWCCDAIDYKWLHSKRYCSGRAILLLFFFLAWL